MTVAGVAVMRYRSKPVEVEAVRVTEKNLDAVARWCGGRVAFADMSIACVMVPTINGEAKAKQGHYVVKGPNDYYPCDDDTFDSRWEAI